MTAMKIHDSERLVSVHYDEMDTLMNRRDSITNTLQNNLNRNGNVQYIRDTYVSVLERSGKTRYAFNIILTPTETK